MLRYEQAISRRQSRDASMVALRRQIIEDQSLQAKIRFENRTPRSEIKQKSDSLSARRERLKSFFVLEEKCLLAELDALTVVDQRTLLIERARKLKEQKVKEDIIIDNNESTNSINLGEIHLHQIEEKKKREQNLRNDNIVYDALIQKTYSNLVNMELEELKEKKMKYIDLDISRREQILQKQIISAKVMHGDIAAPKATAITPTVPKVIQGNTEVPKATVITPTVPKVIQSNTEVLVKVTKTLVPKISQKQDFEKKLELAQGIESEKYWNKRDEEWDKQDHNRRELMKSVYQERANQIKEKQTKRL